MWDEGCNVQVRHPNGLFDETTPVLVLKRLKYQDRVVSMQYIPVEVFRFSVFYLVAHYWRWGHCLKEEKNLVLIHGSFINWYSFSLFCCYAYKIYRLGILQRKKTQNQVQIRNRSCHWLIFTREDCLIQP